MGYFRFYACFLFLSIFVLIKINVHLDVEELSTQVGKPVTNGFKNVGEENNERNSKNLIDFAVVGFNKCGSSFLRWNIFGPSNSQSFMGKEHETEVPVNSEIFNLYRAHVGVKTADGKPIKNGFKNPGVLMKKQQLRLLSKQFPNINFIVTTRHPVWWFQSWYNFRLRSGTEMPPPEKTIGACHDQCYSKKRRCIAAHGCSGEAKVHQWLSRLGWTPLNTDDENSLLGYHRMSIHHFPNASLFLMEISQLSAENRTRADIFIDDLERFLGMENSIPKLKLEAENDVLNKREKTYVNGLNPEEVDKKAIAICDDEHTILRERLVGIGTKSSQWIETYFLKSPHVIVSDKEYFIELIRRWQYDPCVEQAVETDK